MPSAQHVMLAAHCKKTEQVDVKTPVLTYIRNTYSSAEADEAADDLAAVQALRNELVTAQGSAAGPRREVPLVK
jgi:programmed cell death 6-interacting protein